MTGYNMQNVLPISKPNNPFADLVKYKPYYYTHYGAAYNADALKIIKKIPDSSINLIMTSPPYALVFKKEYGNVDAKDYINWFMKFAVQFHRILKDDGSFVIDIGGSWNKGAPTRSLYQFELLIALAKKFYLAQEFYWHNPAKLPSPAEWVTVRRIRVKDSIETIWWMSKTEYPKADNTKVLKPYSKDMQRLLVNGYRAKERPSGHNITPGFNKDQGGSIPPNLLTMGNNDANSQYFKMCKEHDIKPHPARYPRDLPEFFIKFLTSDNDIVLDPFCGSNVTGMVAEEYKRRWIGIDTVKEYLDGSMFRFPATFKG
jgi:site-specific DNA-methyltransferase (cytosine-N4-specific)